MKKIALCLLVGLILVNLSACGEAKKDSTTATSQESATSSKSQAKLDWPEEFEKWGVPEIQDVELSFSDNKSMVDGMLVQGVTASVNVKELDKGAFDAYGESLVKEGFAMSANSLDDVMEVYEKVVEGGTIKVTLSFSSDLTTIIINNSAPATVKPDAATSGNESWPTALKNIPEFTKGTYKETIEMGGGMYTITYTGVSESDIEWYRGELKKSGFASMEDSEEETYVKMQGSTSFAVGFSVSGDTLQMIIMTASN